MAGLDGVGMGGEGIHISLELGLKPAAQAEVQQR